VLTHDAPFRSTFDAEVFVYKCNVISEMKLQFTANGVRQLTVVVIVLATAGCGTSANDKNNFNQGSVVDQNPIGAVAEIVGSNCKAEVVTGPNGANHYKSTYLTIFSDGSEQVQNIVETETPCP
jgi:hypothetical protein